MYMCVLTYLGVLIHICVLSGLFLTYLCIFILSSCSIFVLFSASGPPSWLSALIQQWWSFHIVCNLWILLLLITARSQQPVIVLRSLLQAGMLKFTGWRLALYRVSAVTLVMTPLTSFILCTLYRPRFNIRPTVLEIVTKWVIQLTPTSSTFIT